MNHLTLNKLLWSIVTLLSGIAAVIGVINSRIYLNVVQADLLPGIFAQDILTIGVVAFLFFLIISTAKIDIKKQIIILGIVGSLWYLYAIFSIERTYNLLYFFYLAIFSIATFSVISTGINMSTHLQHSWIVPTPIRYITSFFSLFIAGLFTFLWVSALIPLLHVGQRIEFLYSIYILDLCFIMPGFAVTGILNLRNKSAGLIFTPAMFILGIFVIFPLGLGELAKPFYNVPVNIQSMWMSFGLSGIFLLLGSLQLITLKHSAE